MTLFCFFSLLRICAAAVLLLLISICDVRTKRLPSRPVRLLAASSLLRLIPLLPELSGGSSSAFRAAFFEMLAGGAGTFLFLLGITWLSDRLFHADTLGGGDVKLAAALGLHLGLFPALLMLLTASLLALPEALLRQRRGARGFPFAPCLSAAGLLFLILSS